MFTGKDVGEVDDLNSFSVSLDRHEGLSLLVTPPLVDETADVHLA